MAFDASHLVIDHNSHHDDTAFQIDTDYHIDGNANIHTEHQDYYVQAHDATDDNASLTFGHLTDGHGTECTITTAPSIDCHSVTGTWE